MYEERRMIIMLAFV